MSQRKRDPELEQFWRQAVAERERSGLSISAFCAARQLSQANYYAWRRELQKRDRSAPAMTLVPVHVRADAILEVVLTGGVTVRVPAGADASAVARLVAALRAASC
jgi:transposase-like protein